MSARTPYNLWYRIGDSPWSSLPLAVAETLLGRAEDCGLVLNHPLVSRHHASLAVEPDGLWLTDLGSSNGTQLQDQPLPPRRRVSLQPGQSFTVGPYSLLVESATREPPRSAAPVQVAEPAHEPGPAALVETVYDTEQSDLKQVAERLRALNLAAFDSITLGRASDNHVVLDHPLVSRYHAVIERIGPRHRLRDLRSSNGVFVNGQRVERQLWLNEQDEIRIGPYVFAFSAQGLRAQADSGLSIEAVGLKRRVGPRLNLLQALDLSIQPQEFVAIVGVSGAGKTTLLDALSGYRPATGGQVVVDGINLYRHYDLFRNDVGYVPQRDIVHAELTPQAALDFAARLRMPPDTSPAERKQRVAEVLADLDLTDRRKVPVGRLSGGQVKRVSIGVELLTKPRLFFLDEPTSGLDPGTEYDMMKLLRRLADQGRTVVLVTHATKNVMLCDRVVFMAAGGYMAYFGPPDEALAYFDTYRSLRERREKEMEFDDIYRILNDERRGTPAEWGERFRAFTAQATRAAQAQKAAPADRQSARRARISSLRQFLILSARNLKILFQDKVSLALMLAIAPLLGLEDFVWGRNLYDPVLGDASKLIMMWFITGLTATLVGALSSVREIVKEVDIYKRERAVVLRVLPYVLSKAWVGVVLAAYQAGVLLFFRVLFVNPAVPATGGYVVLYVTLFLATLCGYLIGLAISAAAPNQNAAILLMVAVLVPQFLFAGGLLPLSLIPGGETISLFVPTRWTFEAFLRASGIGDTLAQDACWALPEDERQALTEADKADCPCMGANLFSRCADFPGILSSDFYDEASQQALARPQPAEPLQPTPYPTPTPLPTPASPADFVDYLTGLQAQGDEYADARQAQGDEYAGAMRAYGDQRADWQESREKAISSAEGMLGRIYDDFGRAFTGSILTRWAALAITMVALLALILGFTRLKDAV